VLKKLGESMGDIFDMNAMLGGAAEGEEAAAEGEEEEEEEANLHTAASDGERLCIRRAVHCCTSCYGCWRLRDEEEERRPTCTQQPATVSGFTW
jgi:hypothetical protein